MAKPELTDEAIDVAEDTLRIALGSCNPGPLFDHRMVAEQVLKVAIPLVAFGQEGTTVRLKLDTGDLQSALQQFHDDVVSVCKVMAGIEVNA